MRFPDAFLQEVKFRNDIEEVISRYVQLKVSGSKLVACCPFHNEKTPSFTIFRNTKSFHCFGCDKGGDVVTFIMLVENLDYLSAVMKLAEWAKIPIPEDDGEYKNQVVRQKRIYEVNREAALYFHNNLIGTQSGDNIKAAEYVKKRNLKNPTVKHFGLGCALNSWNHLTKYLSEKGFSKEEQKTAFLCNITKNGDYIDYFKGRLMFPIIDINGNVIAFGARALDDKDKPKYLNSSETPVFKKGRNLYALNFAKNSVGVNKKFDYFILCEGYMDVIAMHQAGFTNAVAALGTAITEDQVKLIAKYAKRVVLAYDSDNAGKMAMSKAAGLFDTAGIEVKILSLGQAKDPDEFIQTYGRDKLESQLIKPKGYIDTKLDAVYEKYDIDNAEEKIKAINESCAELALINSEVQREVYGGKLADRYKVSVESVLKEIKKLTMSRVRKEKSDMINSVMRKIDGYGDRVNPDRVKYPESVKKEEIILGILMKQPELYGDVKNILDENLFLSEFNRKIFSLFKDAVELNNTKNGFDTIMITKDFSPEETGRITKMMILDGVPEKNIKSELENFIQALQKQNELYEQKNIDYKEIASSGDDAFINFIQERKAKELSKKK